MFHIILSFISNEHDNWLDKYNLQNDEPTKYDFVIDSLIEQNITIGGYFSRLYGCNVHEKKIVIEDADTSKDNVNSNKRVNVYQNVEHSKKGKYRTELYNNLTIEDYDNQLSTTRYLTHKTQEKDELLKAFPTDVSEQYNDINEKFPQLMDVRFGAHRQIEGHDPRFELDGFQTPYEQSKNPYDKEPHTRDLRYLMKEFIPFYYIQHNVRPHDEETDDKTDDEELPEHATMLVNPPPKRSRRKWWKKPFKSIKSIGKSLNPMKGIQKGIKLIGDIGKFIIDLAKLAIEILKKFAQLIFKPHQLIEFIIQILILCVSLVVSIVGNIKLGGAKGDEIAFRVKHLLTYLGGCFFYFLFYLLSYYSPRVPLYAVFYWIQFYIDIAVYKGSVSSFYYKWLDACENPPDDWYTVTGYHEGNKNASNSMIGYKSLTCPQGYKIDNFSGSMCIKKESYEPNMCPQANIYRMYHANLNPTYPLRPLPFSPSSKFANNSKQKRYAELKEYNAKKKEFYDNCSVTMKPYDNVTKNICRNLDTYQGSALKRDELESLCHDTYCGHGNYEAFCYKLNDKYKIKNNDSNQLKHYYNIAWTIVLILSLLYVSNLISNQEFKDWIKANLKQIKNKRM